MTTLITIAALFLAGPAHADAIEASSELVTDDGIRHQADLAFDGSLSTGWAEASDGSGDGEWIELRMDRPVDIVSVSVWPGNVSDGKRSVKQYGRPRTLTVSLSGRGGEPISRTQVIEDSAVIGPQRVDIPIRGRARNVRIAIDEVYEGIVYNDTYIAEIALNFAEGEPHPWVGKVFSWIEGDEGVRPREKNAEEVAALLATAKTEEEGARDALRELMDRAGNGAPYVRRWTARYVPLGFRLHAIPPDAPAVEALLSLKDPNAIPALEQASIRVTGHDERRLGQQVEMFYAYQELIGGPNRNVPNWGGSGWAVGELLGFGEPLGLAVDEVGQLYVADVGNSRVQRFSDTGKVNRTWGADEAGITNAWLGGERPWYVSGAAPGGADGQLTLPLDVTIVPGRFGDGFAVLDASGRVQVFANSGDLQSSFKVPVHNIPLIPGVGGQAYIEYLKGKLIVFWSDAAWVYTLDGEEQNRWEIADGVPSGTTVLKGNKLGLIFETRLVMFSPDGFRHGSILGATLGSGFEAWDVTMDQDSRLWAVTDTGWAVKYKKPGKVEYKVRISEHGLILPRIAVQNDVIYVLQADGIDVIDALELHRRDELEAQDGS